MTRISALTALALLVSTQGSALLPSARAQTAVELFTSQSCSSCPPAEALFRELARRPDLVVLEWHVDYWDDLRVGAAGRWKDPFSSPGHTQRQRAYNIALRGRGDVYTPQAVVGGVSETTGFDARGIEALVKSQKPSPVRIQTRREGGARFEVTGAPKGAVGLLVTFQREAATRVRGGENNGRDLRSANLVTSFRNVALDCTIPAAPATAGQGCALLVSDGAARPILAAAYCPA